MDYSCRYLKFQKSFWTVKKSSPSDAWGLGRFLIPSNAPDQASSLHSPQFLRVRVLYTATYILLVLYVVPARSSMDTCMRPDGADFFSAVSLGDTRTLQW